MDESGAAAVHPHVEKPYHDDLAGNFKPTVESMGLNRQPSRFSVIVLQTARDGTREN